VYKMSKISTSDCKKFLTDKFPETKSVLWKRITKYKNSEGLYVRVFQYNDDKMVGLLEDGDTLSIVKDDGTLERKNSAAVNFHVTPEDRNEFADGFNIPVRDPDEVESIVGQYEAGAKKFIFSVYKEQMDMLDLGKSVFIAIVEYDFWLENGFLNDQASYEPANYMPQEWQAEDVNDCGSWLVYTNLTPLEIEAKMKSIGFVWSQDFDDFINQQ
jgi:hypothetical protein